MKISGLLAVTSLAILGLVAPVPATAATKAEIDKSVTTTLSEFNALDKSHPRLGKKSVGMLVFPHVTKAGVGVGGEFGEGVLQVNGKTIGYYNTAAASAGLTLGVAEHSEIIMFMTQKSLDNFTQSNGWSIGADADITVVSKGASETFDSMTEQKHVLAFVFEEKGLLGDVSLAGSKITKLTK
jgi:lipid-binding SYLF domain-containing protein